MLTADKCVQKVGRQTRSLFLNWEARKLPENRIDAELLQRRRVASVCDGGGGAEPVVAEAAGAKLQLFARKRAARGACRETGSEERERKIDANEGRVLPHARLRTSVSSNGHGVLRGVRATPPASHLRDRPADRMSDVQFNRLNWKLL